MNSIKENDTVLVDDAKMPYQFYATCVALGEKECCVRDKDDNLFMVPLSAISKVEGL